MPGDREPIAARQIADLLKGSVEIVTEYRCEYHPSRSATSVCECCYADLCSDCSNVRSHRLVCNKCMGAVDKTLGGTGAAASLTKLLTHPFLIALLIAALLAVVFVRLGGVHRKGLLAAIPANAMESKRQFRLKLLLYSKKADRIETHGDALYEMGRFDKAAIEYERAKTIYETLISETDGRWEQSVLGLARAAIMEKMGQQSYAEGLYKNLAIPSGPDRTYQVIAELRLAKIQEKTDPGKALETYTRLLKDILLVPDKFSSALNIMAHTDQAYNYESRLRMFTHTDVDFDEIKAEALLRMGLILLKMGRESEAEYRLSRAAAEADGTWLEKWASSELHKLKTIKALERRRNEAVPERKEEEERVTITHF